MDGATPSSRRRSDGHGGTKSRNKKRKQSTDIIEEMLERSESARFDKSRGGKGERSPWTSLQLVLSLQDRNIDIAKYV